MVSKSRTKWAVTPRGWPSGAKTSSRTRRLVAVAESIWSAMPELLSRSRSRWASAAASLVKAANAAEKSERGNSPRKASSNHGSTTAVTLARTLAWRAASMPSPCSIVITVSTPGTSDPWLPGDASDCRRAVSDVVAGVAADGAGEQQHAPPR